MISVCRLQLNPSLNSSNPVSPLDPHSIASILMATDFTRGCKLCYKRVERVTRGSTCLLKETMPQPGNGIHQCKPAILFWLELLIKLNLGGWQCYSPRCHYSLQVKLRCTSLCSNNAKSISGAISRIHKLYACTERRASISYRIKSVMATAYKTKLNTQQKRGLATSLCK